MAETRAKTRWHGFRFADAAYDYSGESLEKHWSRLHLGDCEPFPEPAGLKKLVALHPTLKPSMSLAKAATALQDAWRAYHRGDFGEAIELGLGVGLLGYDVANKATSIYATYLESDKEAKTALFLEAARRAEELSAAAKSIPNAWYLHGQALGRYSQCISVAKALAQGLGGKVKSSLERAISLQRHHADAHIGMGVYHAAVIHQAGAMIGGLAYGASKDAAVQHFETALKLNPHSAIARIEFANGLAMMFGKEKLRQATALYEEASACSPVDAMERLDVELAKSELDD